MSEQFEPTAPINNDGNHDPTLSPVEDLQAVLSGQLEQFNAQVPQETVVDQHDFQRTRFSLDNGVSFVFRGREELPVIPGKDSDIATEVLTADEKPVYTDVQEFDAWKENQTTTESAAAKEFIASDTPRGIVEAALTVIKSGNGSEEEAPRLEKLRAKVINDEVDDEVLGLFDIIYTAGAVDLKTGKVRGDRASSEAPMLVALALGGNELAQEVINTKRQIVETEDQKTLDSENVLKRPGEPLSDSELALMKDAHFIAVHTTPTAPEAINEQGDRGIFPSGAYNLGQQIHYPRETIHWSLNHAVDSHMMGDFKGREITIVDPLDELARANGAPTVLYGVDTYFSSSPGEPLVLSGEASVVELKDDGPDQPFIVRDGSDIHIRKGGIKPEDFSTLEKFLGYDKKDQEHGLEGMGKSLLASDLQIYGGLYLDQQIVERIVYGDKDNAFKMLNEEERARNEEYLKPFKTAYELIKPELPETPTDKDYEHGLKNLYGRIVNGEVDIAEHPELHGEIIETVRIMVVNKLIEEKGGKVEEANGQSHYMVDEEFKAKEEQVVAEIGLKSGLHDNNLEGWSEEQFRATRSKATSGNYEAGTLKFDWAKYDDSNLWQVMADNSWQNRRYMVRSGMLSFTPSKVQRKQSNGLVAVPSDWA